jgi:FkbM family methyltransferase
VTEVLGKIASDFAGLRRVCGWGVALRWVFKILTNFGECKRTRGLQPADRAMGDGPFESHYGSARAKMFGAQVISGIREIWVRDLYLSHGFLTIPPDAHVIDLGANMGNFTMLALAHGPGVRVVSVEPTEWGRKKIVKQLEVNGWSDRVQICPNFLGGETDEQRRLRANNETPDARFMSEEEFIQAYRIDRIDLIKCDIEGSEFALITPQSRLLKMARQFAAEVHIAGGDLDGFIAMLQSEGFEVQVNQRDAEGLVLSARRKS